MASEIVTFSYKWPGPRPGPGAWIVDVRGLRNPYRDPRLRAGDGRDPIVAHDVETSPNFADRYRIWLGEARAWPGPVWVGCTGGRHRSVVVGIRLAADLQVPVRHRDLDR